MRILLAGYGTRGDVQPLVALGVRLRADGHDVAIAASQVFADLVRGQGLEFHTAGGDVEALLRRHGEVLVKHQERMLRTFLEFARAEADGLFDQTYEAARGADLIAAGVHSAAPSVAEALGLPYRTLLFCPQMVPSRHHPPMGLPWLSLPALCNRILWWALRRGFHAMLGDAINRRRRAWDLPPIGDVTAHLLTDRPIVASDALLGAPPPDASPGIVQTGSLALAEDGPLEPALERFLAAGEPPICAGFGSMPDGDPRGTTRAVIEAFETCGRRGLILSGWAGLGEGALPPTVFVAGSAPHARLFPRVALAVHHGGAGTTAAVARAGVPQIVVPHIADQHYWGRQVFERGLGSRPIARCALTAAKLARAIRDVLSRPEIADRAREIKAGLDRTDGVSTLAQLLYEVPADAPAHRAAA